MTDHTGLLALSDCESRGQFVSGGHAFKRSFTLGWPQRNQAWACAKGRATKWAPAAVSSVGGLPSCHCVFPVRVPRRKKRETQKVGRTTQPEAPGIPDLE